MVDSHEIDIAWAAGLFDGEGHVWLDPQRPWDKKRKRSGKRVRGKFLLRPKVKMTHQLTIERLAEIFRGGRISPPRKSKKPNRKDTYDIHWNGKAGERFLRAVRPYLVTKAEEARIALDHFVVAPKGPDGDEVREACYQALREVRRRLEEGITAASGTISVDLSAPNESLQPINPKVRVCTTRSLFDQDGD